MSIAKPDRDTLNSATFLKFGRVLHDIIIMHQKQNCGDTGSRSYSYSMRFFFR